ncbi:MAG: hypothetical protein BWK73_18935 [Thiothrix lacustris]|uniref:Thioredoxin domain-containing protein n=1 Tax=Thiothrix lacustris TaxID=525917 RepID=A0A1Y1QQ77_9GAMM|nr:MAG: hypothetical protein BWK73_18935 [Thiothrix lacustris]
MKAVLIPVLIALSVAVSSVSAADQPAADKPTAAPSTDISTPPDQATESGAPAKVETREAAKFFDETFNDMQDEIETAKTDGKQGVLIMFEMDECPFCHRMKTTVLNRSDIQDYYKEHFRIVSVDIEGDVELTNFKGETTTQKDFALKEFRVRATPVFQFIGLDGEPVKNGRLTGATKDADEFMLFGKYVVDKKNEDLPFSKFKREQTSDANS